MHSKIRNRRTEVRRDKLDVLNAKLDDHVAEGMERLGCMEQALKGLGADRDDPEVDRLMRAANIGRMLLANCGRDDQELTAIAEYIRDVLSDVEAYMQVLQQQQVSPDPRSLHVHMESL